MEARGQHARTAPVRVLTGLLIPAALAVASAMLCWAASAPIAAVRAPGPAPVDALLALGAALLCAALLALVAVGATLSLAVVLSGQVGGRLTRLAKLLTPAVVRSAVGLAVGVTVLAGPVVAASSAAPSTSLTTSMSTSMSATAATNTYESPESHHQTLPPGWSPDRPASAFPGGRPSGVQPVTSEATDRSFGGRPGTDASSTAHHVAPVVVHRGDTLWAIAGRHLGPRATEAQVAAEWPRWHAANRSMIGPDPDLIRPGQRLQAPHRRAPTDRAPTDRAPTSGEESP